VQFNSYSYLLALVVVVPLFWALSPRLRRPFVLTLSGLFYASWSLTYAPLPFAICVVVFICGRIIVSHPASASAALKLGIGSTLAVLILFKYGAFLQTNLGVLLRAFGYHSIGNVVLIALPLGISFYTFEAISYLLDAKQGRVGRIGFADLVMFVTFWPHLIAGPIVRVRELVPQLKFEKAYEPAMLVRGLDRLVWGLVQKNLFANNLAPFVDEAFLPQAAHLNTTVDNWFCALAFGLQIYFDFAAYSNMAIGVACLMGVRLPENFNYPYHALTPPDFWSRWHMTLSRWIRDYLFFPINARFRGAPVPLYLSLIGVMALVGLWHGAGWGFAIWGTMHGFYLVAYRVWEAVSNTRLKRLGAWPPMRWLWQGLTIAAVMAAWIPFRANTLGQAGIMLRSLVIPHGLHPSYTVNFYLVTLLAAGIAAVEPLAVAALTRLEAKISQPASLFLWRPALYAFGLLLFLVFDDRDTQFIYFQF
jgi:alginate O-acetyltransferase complex protein AlgI